MTGTDELQQVMMMITMRAQITEASIIEEKMIIYEMGYGKQNLTYNTCSLRTFYQTCKQGINLIWTTSLAGLQ